MSGDSARRPFANEGMCATGINLSATNARTWNANVAPQPYIIIIIIISGAPAMLCETCTVLTAFVRVSVCMSVCLSAQKN